MDVREEGPRKAFLSNKKGRFMFLAHAVQVGEGCDYNISCGEILWALDATTKEEAIKELKRKVIGEWDDDEQDFDDACEALSELTLIEVSEKEDIPLDQWYKEAKDFKIRQKKQKKYLGK